MNSSIPNDLPNPASSTSENFVDLLDSFLGGPEETLEGRIVQGTVVAIEKDMAVIDVGLKSEGRVPLKDFRIGHEGTEVKVGDLVEVFIERLEDKHGEVTLSRERARREALWGQLERAHAANERVQGVVYSRVKGGLSVDLGGATAFLPGSQVDVRPIKDLNVLLGIPQPFMILKMDRVRGNIVVSRRAVLEESRFEQRSELVSNLAEGQVLEGTVKNLTDYGAFVDLGGIDGLLHVTDISWRRVNHPGEILSVGQNIRVVITKFNKDTHRISLGMKQLDTDPWMGVEAKYPVGAVFRGVITNVADYGAFVELETGVEGLVHVSEMNWTKKNLHPNKLVRIGQEVDVKVLDTDPSKRRISLGIKQCMENPWQVFADAHKVGDEIEGEIRNITDFGLFVSIGPEIDGMVHATDLAWDKSGEEALKGYERGQKVRVKVLDIDPEKERVGLGIKQLKGDVIGDAFNRYKKDQIVTCTVKAITEGALEVRVGEAEIPGFIKRADLSRDRAEQRTERFAVGEKLDAMVISLDKKARTLGLSIRQHEITEEKKAMAQFGSSDSGASLGDILGAAMNRAKS